MPAAARLSRLLLPLPTVALLLGGCSSGGAGGTTAGAGSLDSCTPDRLTTVSPGRLTLSTGTTTRAPWVVDADVPESTSADPSDGLGYDAAVGVALAARLGYAEQDATWVSTPFPSAIAPGDKPFDVHVGQATISDERRSAVDLSTPYYVVRQAVVSVAGRAVTGATRLAELQEVSLAALAGSDAEAALRDIEPALRITAFEDVDQLRRSVSSGDHDAMVVDLQSAMVLDRDDTQLVDGELVGQLPRHGDSAETYGLVLQHGSRLTRCVDAALESLRADGTLDRLEQEWLIAAPGFPELD